MGACLGKQHEPHRVDVLAYNAELHAMTDAFFAECITMAPGLYTPVHVFQAALGTYIHLHLVEYPTIMEVCPGNTAWIVQQLWKEVAMIKDLDFSAGLSSHDCCIDLRCIMGACVTRFPTVG